MTDNSKGRVTITLGRSGQVVKRAPIGSDNGYSDSMKIVGSKRSVRDRLGVNYDELMSSESTVSSKRQRGESSLTSLSSNVSDDVCIRKDDLRFKLMQKEASKSSRGNGGQKHVDLRQKLSKSAQQPLRPPVRRFDSGHSMAELKEISMSGQIPHRRSVSDLRHPETSNNSHSPWTLDQISRRSPERTTNSRFLSSPRIADERQRRPFSGTDDVRTVSYMNKDAFDTPRSSNGPATFVTKPGIPKDAFNTPRSVNGPATFMTKPAIPKDAFDTPRSVNIPPTFVTKPAVPKDAFDTPRSVNGPPTFVSKSAIHMNGPGAFVTTSSIPIPSTSAKPAVPPMGQLPPLSGIIPNNPYGVPFGAQPIEEPQTVEGLLHSLGLGKYAITFKAEEVDMAALKQMGERDLKELGIPMGTVESVLTPRYTRAHLADRDGPRKKILLALIPRSKGKLESIPPTVYGGV